MSEPIIIEFGVFVTDRGVVVFTPSVINSDRIVASVEKAVQRLAGAKVTRLSPLQPMEATGDSVTYTVGSGACVTFDSPPEPGVLDGARLSISRQLQHDHRDFVVRL